MFFKPSSAPGCTHYSWLTPLAGVVGLGLLVAALTPSAHANDQLGAHSYLIDVPVVSSTPVIAKRTVERPERVCEPLTRTDRRSYNDRAGDPQNEFARGDYYYGSRDDNRHQPRRSGGVGAQILGGLIGGAIGNQFGGGSGRKALTIAGALVGSAIARGGSERNRSRDHYSSRDIEPDYVCRTTTHTRTVDAVIGYDVTYRYNDSLHTRRMEHDPGDSLELRIRAVPVPVASSTAGLSNTVLNQSTQTAQPVPAALRPRRTL